MSAVRFYAALGIELPDQGGEWRPVRCFKPDHDHDRNPSCSVSVEHGGWRCHACDQSGSAYDAAVLRGRTPRDAAELCKRHDLGNWDDGGRGVRVLSPPTTAQPLNTPTSPLRRTRRPRSCRSIFFATSGSRTTRTPGSRTASCASPTATPRATRPPSVFARS